MGVFKKFSVFLYLRNKCLYPSSSTPFSAPLLATLNISFYYVLMLYKSKTFWFFRDTRCCPPNTHIVLGSANNPTATIAIATRTNLGLGQYAGTTLSLFTLLFKDIVYIESVPHV